MGESGLGDGQRPFQGRKLLGFLRGADGVAGAADAADGAHHFRVVALPDEDYRGTVRAVAGNHVVKPRHKGTGQVDHLPGGLLQLPGDVGGHTMASDDDGFPGGLFTGMNGVYAHGFQLFDHLRIMDDLAEGNDLASAFSRFQRAVYRAPNPHAEARMSGDFNAHPFASRYTRVSIRRVFSFSFFLTERKFEKMQKKINLSFCRENQRRISGPYPGSTAGYFPEVRRRFPY